MVLRALGAFLDLAAPPACQACGSVLRNSHGLCNDCRRIIELWPRPCTPCSTGRSDSDTTEGSTPGCPLCRGHRAPMPLRFAGIYEGPLRKLVLAAKWQRQPAAIEQVSEWALDAALKESWLDEVDAWCPVPRDPWRWLRHGVPLSELIGRYVAHHRGLPRIAPPRRRYRAPQAGLIQSERLRNLRGAFSVGRRTAERFQGRSILLVDDVYTTGSTVSECAKALIDAGAREVRTLVVAVRP